jgi:hypothetical protein
MTVAGEQGETDPWHYQWQWHNGQPPPSQDRTNGQIRMAVHADQNHNWSDVHWGFGVAPRIDRPGCGRKIVAEDGSHVL